MTGLEKITNQILEEAKQNSEKQLQEASAQADEILQEADKACELLLAQLNEQTNVQLKLIDEQAKSGALLQKRQAILAAKQQLISQTIEEAKASLTKLDDAAYFDLLLKMAGKFALGQNGKLLLSEKDKARLPKDFEKRLSDALKNISGAALSVSQETRNIDGGFVLDYDGIEENCSFEALFYADLERLQDFVHGILF